MATRLVSNRRGRAAAISQAAQRQAAPRGRRVAPTAQEVRESRNIIASTIAGARDMRTARQTLSRGYQEAVRRGMSQGSRNAMRAEARAAGIELVTLGNA